MYYIEDAFNVEICDEEASDNLTIKSLASLVKKLIRNFK
jgi:acyl carrier protein